MQPPSSTTTCPPLADEPAPEDTSTCRSASSPPLANIHVNSGTMPTSPPGAPPSPAPSTWPSTPPPHATHTPDTPLQDTPRTSLLDLPQEIVCHIVSYITSPADVNALLRCSKASRALQHNPVLQLKWLHRQHTSYHMLHQLITKDQEDTALLLLGYKRHDNPLAAGLDVCDPGPHGTPPLTAAAAKGQARLVAALAQLPGVNVNAVDSEDHTALQNGCQGGHVDVVGVLLDAGCDVNWHSSTDGRTALHIACLQAHADIVDMLLGASGVDVEARDEMGNTPLLVACYCGCTAAVRALLAVPGTTHAGMGNVDGHTPLHLACIEGHVEVACMLLHNEHASPLAVGADGCTALHMSCQEGRVECVRLLLTLPDMSAVLHVEDLDGDTPLFLACEGGHLEVVELLLRIPTIPIHLDHAPGEHLSALEVAGLKGHLQVVRALLAALGVYSTAEDGLAVPAGGLPGVEWGNKLLRLSCGPKPGNVLVLRELLAIPGLLDVNSADDQGWTTLHVACSEAWVASVRELVQAPGIKGSLKNCYGYTALHFACEHPTPGDEESEGEGDKPYGHWNAEMVRLLLGLPDVDVNVVDHAGHTPLMIACGLHGGSAAVVQALMSGTRAVDVTVRDPQGFTALHHASKHGWGEVVAELLPGKGFDLWAVDLEGSCPVHLAVAGGHSEVVAQLVAQDPSLVTATDAGGRVPIELACSHGHGPVVAALWEAQRQLTGAAGWPTEHSLLQLACESGHASVVSVLLEAVAEGDGPVRDANGHTLLHVACIQGCSEVVQLLLEKANRHMDVLYVMDLDGRIPLHYACEFGHVEVVRQLLVHGVDQVLCRDSGGHTPLHRACLGGHLEVVLELAAAEPCTVAAVAGDGSSPLHLAFQSQHMHVARHLLALMDSDEAARE